MSLPLEGINVVDMSQVFFGPGAAMYLAEQGAEVIKVEPLRGDSMRYRHTSPYLEARGFSKPFLSLNRNKRAIAVDVHTTEGQEIVHRVAKWADVFILNMRPGSEERVRMDYDTLNYLSPRLIYASISAFGREGPDASLPGYDIVLQSRSGILSTNRHPDGTPVPYAVMVSDMSGCIALSYAIMLALWEREKTGAGQRIDTSLLNQALAMQMQQLVWVEGDDSALPGARPTAMASTYRCEDDQWLTIVVVEDHQWKSLCRVLDLEHLAEDPALASYELRLQRAAELGELLSAVFETRPRGHWLEQLRGANVPSGAVVQREELARDPQAVANQMLLEQDHPVVGRVKMVALPFHLSGSRDETRLRRPAPSLGQHTDDILREMGYDAAAVSRLRQQGVVK
jgi:crotonobetainyl-CoA:carnitine CoA-transferase CaiB-like acyl-CoA transferase